MCLKTCCIIIILFHTSFMHAYTTNPTSIAHHTKIDEKLKFKKFSSNGRRQHIFADHSKNAAPGCTEDCTSSSSPPSLPKARQHVAQSKGSGWADENVRAEMEDVETTTLREEEEYLSVTDYQPPHRKSPIHNK